MNMSDKNVLKVTVTDTATDKVLTEYTVTGDNYVVVCGVNRYVDKVVMRNTSHFKKKDIVTVKTRAFSV
jgi:hypothetical protein